MYGNDRDVSFDQTQHHMEQKAPNIKDDDRLFEVTKPKKFFFKSPTLNACNTSKLNKSNKKL